MGNGCSSLPLFYYAFFVLRFERMRVMEGIAWSRPIIHRSVSNQRRNLIITLHDRALK